jgi:hypothetical protein
MFLEVFYSISSRSYKLLPMGFGFFDRHEVSNLESFLDL